MQLADPQQPFEWRVPASILYSTLYSTFYCINVYCTNSRSKRQLLAAVACLPTLGTDRLDSGLMDPIRNKAQNPSPGLSGELRPTYASRLLYLPFSCIVVSVGTKYCSTMAPGYFPFVRLHVRTSRNGALSSVATSTFFFLNSFLFSFYFHPLFFYSFLFSILLSFFFCHLSGPLIKPRGFVFISTHSPFPSLIKPTCPKSASLQWQVNLDLTSRLSAFPQTWKP